MMFNIDLVHFGVITTIVLAIGKAAENDILYETISTVRELLTYVQRAIAKAPGLRSRSLKYHQKIYENIRDGKELEAAKVMHEHLSDVERVVEEYLKSQYLMPTGGSCFNTPGRTSRGIAVKGVLSYKRGFILM